MDNPEFKKYLITKTDEKIEIIRALTNELIENVIDLRSTINEIRFLKVISEDIKKNKELF